MMLSEALTRGPYREKWVQFIRSQDLINSMVAAIPDAGGKDFEDLSGALELAENEQVKIIEEIRRALKKSKGPVLEEKGGVGP